MNPIEDSIGVVDGGGIRGEMSVEEGGFGGGGRDDRRGRGRRRRRVLEIGADLGDIEGVKRKAGEDEGDEGGGAAQGLGNYDAVSEENVVAIISHHQTPPGEHHVSVGGVVSSSSYFQGEFTIVDNDMRLWRFGCFTDV